jgi:hypothetical protein
MKANDPNANHPKAHDAKASSANAHDVKAKNATRRSFLKNGALLAVPLAAAAAPAAIVADDSLKSRLARLEDEAAIRNLHASWLRQFNAAGASAAAPDSSGHDFSGAASGSTKTRLQPLRDTPPAAEPGEILRRIAPDHAAAPDAIDVAPDGRSASGRFHCLVEIETPILRDSTLAQMAHAQGSGFLRRAERRVLRVTYAKSSGAWSIASATLAPA